VVAIDLAAFCLEASSDDQEHLTLRAIMPNPVFAEGPMQVDLGLMFSAEAFDIGTTAEIKVHVLDADGNERDNLGITWRIDGSGPGGATVAGFPMWRAFPVSLKKLTVRPGLHRVDVSVDGSVKRQLPFMVLPRG
jgi:hypothetical protein